MADDGAIPYDFEPGYYWVSSYLGVHIAHRDGGDWWVTGSDEPWATSQFQWIGPRLDPPESPDGVPVIGVAGG